MCPVAARPTTAPAVTRIPRMQGLPPITFGSVVMRSRFMAVESQADAGSLPPVQASDFFGRAIAPVTL